MGVDHRTLQDLIDQQVSLVFHCQKCEVKTPLDVHKLVACHGARTTVPFIRHSFKCEFCQDETIKDQG